MDEKSGCPIPHASSLRWRDRLRVLPFFERCRGRDFMRRIGERVGADNGATLVETAMACTIFFALLLGAFEFSLAFYTFHYTSSAAREASRYAIVRGSTCQTNLPLAPASFHCGATKDDIANYVKSLGYPGIEPANMTVGVTTCQGDLHAGSNNRPTTTWSTCDYTGTTYNNPGDEVQINVTYSFPLAIPFWNRESVGISSSSSMVYSQ